jgi:hypothetical protein
MHIPSPEFFRLSPIPLLATLIHSEARGEPIEGQVGVAWTVRNRVYSNKWFGGSWHQVMTRWAQYSGLWEQLSSPGNWQATMEFVNRLRSDPTVLQTQEFWVARGIIEDVLLDNTENATHYYATYLDSLGETPSWAKTGFHTATLGGHKFYSGVP